MGVIRSQADDVFHECLNLLYTSFHYLFLLALSHDTRRTIGHPSNLHKPSVNLIWSLRRRNNITS